MLRRNPVVHFFKFLGPHNLYWVKKDGVKLGASQPFGTKEEAMEELTRLVREQYVLENGKNPLCADDLKSVSERFSLADEPVETGR